LAGPADGAARVPDRGAGFRPDIEGLRAVAVLAVVLFHAGLPGDAGGYVGVDVFFVISGFLITGLLLREVAATGRVRFARFYGARARRLLPAAVLVLAATAAGAVLLLPPLQARAALGDAVASALYVGNYRFAAQGTDYLAADVPPSPFQHYWSLGVEEQFYLVWPALLLVVAWLAGRRLHAAAAAVLAVVAAGSVALSLYWTATLPPWAFFALPSRAWQLAAGGLVALTAPWWRRVPRGVSRVLGWVGMAAIVLACVRLGATTPYPGVAAFLPVLGAVLVVAAGCGPARGGVGTALSVPPLRAVGRLSYGWYLWHWPVLILAPALVGAPLGLPGRLVAALVSALLAAVTLVAVENPVRFAPRLRRSAPRSLALAGAASAAGVCTVLGLLTAVPPPVGLGPAAGAPALGVRGPAPARTSPAPAPQDPRVVALQQVVAQAQAAVAAPANLGPVPSNLTPALADAATAEEKPAVFLDGCVRSWLYVGQPECATGDPASPTRIALVGDSHAAMWSPPMEDLAAHRHWRLKTLGKVTCPLLDLPITSPYLGREYTECEQWRGEILDRLAAEHPTLVMIGASHRYTPDYGFTPYSPAWLDSLARTVRRIRAMGAAVLVIGAVPDPHSIVPTCLSDHLEAAAACSPARAAAVDDAGIRAEERTVRAAGGSFADLTGAFCTAIRCPVVVGNRLAFRDDNHVTITYARWLEPVLAAEVDLALAAR
jgi:peptidoglycan/LPS O-acetylase OafA/YrhL